MRSPIPLLFLLMAGLPPRLAMAQPATPGMSISSILESVPICAVSPPLEAPDVAAYATPPQQPCTAKELAITTCEIQSLEDMADCLCKDLALQSSLSECVQKSCDHGKVIGRFSPFPDAPDARMGTALTRRIESGKLLNRFCSSYPRPNRGSDLMIAAIASIAIILPLVVLRCLCRIQRTGRLWWDDWMCVFASVRPPCLTALLFLLTLVCRSLPWRAPATPSPPRSWALACISGTSTPPTRRRSGR